MLQDVFVKNACTTACKVSDQYVASFTLSLTRCTAPCHTRSPRSPRLSRLACLPLLPRSHRCFPTCFVLSLACLRLHRPTCAPSSRSRAGRRLHRHHRCRLSGGLLLPPRRRYYIAFVMHMYVQCSMPWLACIAFACAAFLQHFRSLTPFSVL